MSALDDGFEKEIVRTVDDLNTEKDNVTFTDIHEELDCPKSTLSNKISDLKDEGFIVDRDWKDNSSRLELSEDVSIDVDYRLEEFINTRLIINIIQIFGFVGVAYFASDPANLSIYFMFFLAGFLPSFIHTISEVFLNDDFYEVNVSMS